jgi:hypothetical protein
MLSSDGDRCLMIGGWVGGILDGIAVLFLDCEFILYS